MRILLASPESGVWNSRKHIHMGLGYLAGSLLAHGYEVDIWDAAVEEEQESFDAFLSRNPYDVVGISAPTPLVVSAWEAASIAKKHGAVSILGGPHLTLMPHESMEKDSVDLVAWRPRSVENVIAEWRWLVEDLGATEIGVTDDIWNMDPVRAKELCRALIDNNLNRVPWVTIHGMKVNRTDLELFQLMKAAGCKRVGFGIENGDDEMLRKVIKKGQTVQMARDAVAWAKQAKLQTMGFFIYGMPGETEESMEKTTQLALELDPDLAHFLMATPFPGTEMWDLLQEAGLVTPGNWDQLAISYGNLDAEVVERKWHEAHRRFYLRPSRIMRIALRADTWRRFPYYVKTALSMLLGLGDRKATPSVS
ncbi:MAG: hypothetical protein B6243_11520 [Anaerolineaceae bacterium 4572_5.2]|nr:MAG: hypothetical protein B6243_11520 [Anaerolineaceae bacterium 4572_5.2]